MNEQELKKIEDQSGYGCDCLTTLRLINEVRKLQKEKAAMRIVLVRLGGCACDSCIENEVSKYLSL